VALGAQNMHWDLSGAFTGEISAPMLLDLGVTYVILGHSERRQYFGETDEAVNRKVKTALAQGLHPIVAVGETLGEREDGRTRDRVVTQTRAALDGLNEDEIARLILAYEPIWAIGSGQELRRCRGGRRHGRDSRLSRRFARRAEFSTAAA